MDDQDIWPGGQVTWTTPPDLPGAGTGMIPLDDPYGDPQRDFGPAPGYEHDSAGPVTEPLPAWPQRHGTRRPGRERPRRTRMMLAALVTGLCAGVTVAALAGTQTLLVAPADNPSAIGQYTPTAGSSGTTSPPAATPSASTAPASMPPPPPGTAADPPAVSKTTAEQVLAGYWTANNQADQTRSGQMLAAIEAGTSYRMDTGAYRTGQAEDPGNTRYVPLAAQESVLWIPRQPAGQYPRWFAARVTLADARTGHLVSTGYVVFNQSAPGGPWKNVLEPYLLPSAGPGPFVATDGQGYASQASPDMSGLAVPPGQIEARTAASLDGTLDGGQPGIQDPGNLTDIRDEQYFAAHGAAAAGQHAPGGMVFALRTVGGGALVFYSLTATLTLTPQDGQSLAIGIPGYYSPSQPVTAPLTIGYVEQFAAYLPSGGAAPQLLADASGISG